MNQELRFCSHQVALARIQYSVQRTEAVNEELRARCALLEEENARLQEELEDARAEIIRITTATLDELVARCPHIPQLFTAVQEAEQWEAKKQKKKNLSELKKLFPYWSSHYKKKVWYEPAFFRALRKKCTEEEFHLAADAVALLSEHGPEYPSLAVKRSDHALYGSPKGAMIARGGELRFTFTNGSEALIIHRLYRRSETRYSGTE